MKIIDRPSPSYSSRDDVPIEVLILHYTGMRTGEEALARLTNAEAQVSAHYTIDEDGTVYRHVDEAQKAWHAGVSHWRGHDGMNAYSVGIEIVNPGHEFGYCSFPKAQMKAVAELSKAIIERHGIAQRNVIGHSDVAPGRKEDPGELFDWPWLAGQGIGIWPEFNKARISNVNLLLIGDEGTRILDLQRRLEEYGYKVPITGRFCEVTRNVVIAFQRHFRPQDFSGQWDTQSDARLNTLLTAVR